MLIQTFILKVINNDRKVLTDHEITDHIAEQIESVIIQVCIELKFWIHPNLPRSVFFFLWQHGEEKLKGFIEKHLNEKHPTIKFTAKWSQTSINFTDRWKNYYKFTCETYR